MKTIAFGIVARIDVFSTRICIRNLFEPSKVVEKDLIVNTGATYTVLPASLLRELGVKLVNFQFHLLDSIYIEVRKIVEVMCRGLCTYVQKKV